MPRCRKSFSWRLSLIHILFFLPFLSSIRIFVHWTTLRHLIVCPSSGSKLFAKESPFVSLPGFLSSSPGDYGDRTGFRASSFIIGSASKRMPKAANVFLLIHLFFFLLFKSLAFCIFFLLFFIWFSFFFCLFFFCSSHREVFFIGDMDPFHLEGRFDSSILQRIHSRRIGAIFRIVAWKYWYRCKYCAEYIWIVVLPHYAILKLYLLFFFFFCV